MSRFSAAVAIIGLGTLFIVTSGCAGELTEEQKEIRDGAVGSGGSGGSGGGGTGGSGGSGVGNPETCVLAMAKEKQCAAVPGCHGGTNAAAGLQLTEDALRQAKDNFLDKPNKGAMPGCNAGVQKLIDKAQPEKSLLYTKLLAQPGCGARMPSGGSLSDAELSCTLAWIKSVAGVP